MWVPIATNINREVSRLKSSKDPIVGLRSPSQGYEVNILLTATSTHAQVTIIDQGPGISAAEIPLLFRKFARLSPRPTAGESSTGLGLYIVKLLTSQIKGSIAVDSTLGKGTRFKLEFPRMD